MKDKTIRTSERKTLTNVTDERLTHLYSGTKVDESNMQISKKSSSYRHMGRMKAFCHAAVLWSTDTKSVIGWPTINPFEIEASGKLDTICHLFSNLKAVSSALRLAKYVYGAQDIFTLIASPADKEQTHY